MPKGQQELRAVGDSISLRKKKEKLKKPLPGSRKWEKLALKAASEYATQSTSNEEIRTKTSDTIDALADLLACFNPEQAIRRAEGLVKLTETEYTRTARNRPLRYVGIFPTEPQQIQHNLTKFNQAQFAVEVAYETARRAGWTRPTTIYERTKETAQWQYGAPRPENFPTQTECTFCSKLTHGWATCQLWMNARSQLGWIVFSRTNQRENP